MITVKSDQRLTVLITCSCLLWLSTYFTFTQVRIVCWCHASFMDFYGQPV